MQPGAEKPMEEEWSAFDNSASWGSTPSWGNNSTRSTTEWSSTAEFARQASQTQPSANWAQRVSRQPETKWHTGFMKAAAAKKGIHGAAAAAATMNAGKESRDPSKEHRKSTTNLPTRGSNTGSQGSKSTDPGSPGGPGGGRSGQATAGSTAGRASQSGPTNAGQPSQQSSAAGRRNSAPGGPSGGATSSKSMPSSKPTSASPTKPPESDFSSDSPELRRKKQEIERKLRAMMDKPIADRKKALRELMLEYHPDKSSDPLAKDVFQFINSARAWFLVET